ncbi:MAG TPA: DUF1905 domain-containing protein [Solirubrobacterales bacterium]|nr:DUF1905 domain-containing protein [Solirubrobacterales bacterium]
MSAEARAFEATPVITDRGHVRLPFPFDPREEWNAGARTKVSGTIAGEAFEGSIGIRDGQAFVVLNAAFREAAGVEVGTPVAVELAPLA